MKAHNAVVGMEVQVKHNCRGNSDEFIKKGLVCTVSRIDDGYLADYELRLAHPDIDCGYAWVNASDVRRYIKPTESPEPDSTEPTYSLKVGDYIVAQDGTITLDDKVPYRVVDTSAGALVGIALSSSRHAGFRKCFYIKRSAVIKILREVDDATPRMVKSGSESTCRSE